MPFRVRVAVIAWIAGVAGLALALTVTALVAGHVTVQAPVAHQFRPVAVPPAAPRPTASPTASTIFEADIAPTPRPTPNVPAISADVRASLKPKPKPKPSPIVRSTAKASTKSVPSVADARAYARARIGATQFSCLDNLWTKESHWNPRAYNSSSGAYGIPQALPGSKMSSFGSDWRYNPLTQVRWGLSYIANVYGSACSAWSHSVTYNWY